MNAQVRRYQFAPGVPAQESGGMLQAGLAAECALGQSLTRRLEESARPETAEVAA